MDENVLADKIIAELLSDSVEVNVAYRGRHRWIQTLERNCIQAKE